MAHSITIKCEICLKEEKFLDIKEATNAKWQILAWKVESNEPICTCPQCEYKPLTKTTK